MVTSTSNALATDDVPAIICVEHTEEIVLSTLSRTHTPAFVGDTRKDEKYVLVDIARSTRSIKTHLVNLPLPDLANYARFSRVVLISKPNTLNFAIV